MLFSSVLLFGRAPSFAIIKMKITKLMKMIKPMGARYEAMRGVPVKWQLRNDENDSDIIKTKGKSIPYFPSKHTTLFQRFNNGVDVQTTLYQRQNDVV